MEVRGKLTKIKQALGFCDYLLLRREGQLFLINTFVSHVRGKMAYVCYFFEILPCLLP